MASGYLFVYGTLLTGRENHAVVASYVQAVHPARVRGRLYHLPYGYPALCLPADGWARGEVLTLARWDEVIAALDRLEEYHGPGHPANEYERIQVVAEAAGEQFLVWVYVWAWPGKLPVEAVLIPDGDWRRYMSGRE